MIRKVYWLLGLVLLLYTVVSCRSPQTDTPLPTPTSGPSLLPTATLMETDTPVKVAEGRAGIRGKVVLDENWKRSTVHVYAAPFYEAQTEGEGFFVLEPSIHPSTQLNADGSFELVDIEPRSYVLVVGPSPDEAQALQESGTPKVFRLEPNEVLDIGEVRLR